MLRRRCILPRHVLRVEGLTLARLVYFLFWNLFYFILFNFLFLKRTSPIAMMKIGSSTRLLTLIPSPERSHSSIALCILSRWTAKCTMFLQQHASIKKIIIKKKKSRTKNHHLVFLLLLFSCHQSRLKKRRTLGVRRTRALRTALRLCNNIWSQNIVQSRLIAIATHLCQIPL